MKQRLMLLVLLAMVLLVCAPSSAVESAPPISINLLNPPKDGLLDLAVGESYTFDIAVTSDEPFTLAVAMTDAYYPGRGVFWHGIDRASRSTSALLQLTMTGKASTAGLPAVCDWPEPGYCWPDGVAPVSIVAGVRFAGGVTVSEVFPFAVVVP